jgi:hypothetical protein
MTNRGHHCEPKAKQSRGEPQQTKLSTAYRFPPLQNVPLNLNGYFRDCPTLFGSSSVRLFWSTYWPEGLRSHPRSCGQLSPPSSGSSTIRRRRAVSTTVPASVPFFGFCGDFPITANSILSRMQEVSLNSSIMRQMRAVAFVDKLIEQGQVTVGNQILVHGVEARM